MDEDSTPPPPKRKAQVSNDKTTAQTSNINQTLSEIQKAVKEQAEATNNLSLAISMIMNRLDKLEANVANLNPRTPPIVRQGRKVIFFVDNCGAHGSVSNLEAIWLEFLLPNTTSMLQPMDQGVIQNIKAHYRARLLSRTVLCLGNGKAYKVDILAAIHICWLMLGGQ
ncbi:hypothetical protein HPB51_012178 [Rhipicephalus microplus]|uniref:DDE-1 domain-containing protein n=1 Tax=Rhipicephalus microplus TaxID=6941 RepID=A0A9J6D9I6_RHIMP|nr:hypothetical protein HPB51_012178 [Rhipicephalus microplus]